MRSLFAVTIWGKDYIDEFVKVTLPMHMAKGNLQNYPHLKDSTYLINTSYEDVDYVQSRPEIQELSKLLNVEIEGEDISGYDKYHALGALQTKTFSKCLAENFECVFPLYSDVLISEGTFVNSMRRINAGYMAVFSVGPQAVSEKIIPSLTASDRFWDSPFSLSVPPRELVKLVFDNLHPFHAPSFWEPKLFTNVPSMIFFKVPGQGVLAHGFHLHPVALKVQEHPAFSTPFYGSLDENFIPTIFSSADYAYVSPDSDELFMCSTESISAGRFQDAGGLPSISRVAAYAEAHTFGVHRDFINFPMRMHTTEINAELWNPIEEKALDVIKRVNQRLSWSDKTLRLEDRAALLGRLYHRKILRRMQAHHTTIPVDWGYSEARIELPISKILLNLVARLIVTSRNIFLGLLMIFFFWIPYMLLGRLPGLAFGLTYRVPLLALKISYRVVNSTAYLLPGFMAPNGRHLVDKVLDLPPFKPIVKFFVELKKFTTQYNKAGLRRWFRIQNKIQSILELLVGKSLTAASNRSAQKKKGILYNLLDYLSGTYLNPLLKARTTGELLMEILIRFIRPPRM